MEKTLEEPSPPPALLLAFLGDYIYKKKKKMFLTFNTAVHANRIDVVLIFCVDKKIRHSHGSASQSLEIPDSHS